MSDGVLIPYGGARTPQEQAVDTQASVWVAASAGSGKTTVLTRRVLALLAAGAPPSKLLCITFTKAAAAEMSNRVAKELAQWAAAAPEDLDKALAEMLGVPLVPRDYIQRARGLFARVLDEPGGLKIQTLHSFCQSLLGRFPIEAGLPPDFTVLEETEAAALRRDALDRLAADPPPDVLDAFATVAALADEEGFLALLDRVVGERARFEQAVVAAGGLEPLIAVVAQRLGVAPDDTPDGLLALVCAEPHPELAGFAAGLAGAKTKTAATAGQALLAFLRAPLADRPRLWPDLVGALLTSEGEPRKTLVPKALSALADVGAALQGWAMQVEARRNAALAQQATAALLRLAGRIFADYAAAKRARAALDYDDLILKALALLRDEAGQGWVMWKLDGGVDHVLIDEAQDVNPEQWDIARLLTEEFFAGETARPQPRTLFVVGDYKQSIFGFQGAAPEKFHRMRDYFRDRVVAARQHWIDAPLDKSYRSSPAVLAAVDAVFSDSPARDGVAEPNRPWRPHRAHRQGQAGVVEVWPLAPPLAEDPSEPWSPAVERAHRETGMDRCARMIARHIRRLLDDPNEILPSHAGRRLQPGDFLILARRRGVFFPRMIRALKAEGVPVAGADRLSLTDQLAVQDLLALARFCLTPDDDLTLAALLKSPLIGWDDDALYALAYGRGSGESLWARLKTQGEDDATLLKLRDWRALADRVPPFEFFAQTLERGGRAALLARLGEEAADAMEELLSQALAFDRGPNGGLEALLAQLERQGGEVKRDSEAAARGEVRLMTAHGAKGLQAPVVILSDLTAKPPAGAAFHAPPDQPWLVWAPGAAKEAEAVRALNAARAQREMEESRRLLYVALTRAEDRLYAIGWSGKSAPPPHNWHALICAGMRRLIGEPRSVDFAAEGFEGWRGDLWRWETPQTAAPDRAAVTAVAAPDVGAPAEWTRRVAPTEPSPTRPLTPSELGEEPPARSPLARSGAGGPARGRLIHRLLQALPDLPPERWETAARRLLARPTHRLSPEDQADIWAETQRVLTHPAAAPLFGSASRAEVPVVGLVGDHAVSGRVDRLAVTEDAVWVVDYKTARPTPSRLEDVALVHIKQMAHYRALLRQIWPTKSVRCFLLWTDAPVLMELPPALLTPIAPA